MFSILAEHYTFNNSLGIWQREEAISSPSFNDMDFEDTLLHSINAVSDKSIMSGELFALQKDWPTCYHFSAMRANLLRPLTHTVLRQAKVLELGCGCGAISRFLAETAADVYAVEGNAKRAAIASARCGGLDNIHVIADSIQNLPPDLGTFDVVTLIGVPESAAAFDIGKNPVLSLLRIARNFLKEDGCLVLAIENKMGLKYFAGIPEEHPQITWGGIAGAYREDVSTQNRQGLIALLEEAGFAFYEQFVPIPDYKLPTSILTPEGVRASRGEWDIASLLSARRPYEDQGIFNLPNAWRCVTDAGLLPEMANSLCFVAHATEKRTADIWGHDVLMHHYGHTLRDSKRFAKWATVKRVGEGVLVYKAPFCDVTQSDKDPYESLAAERDALQRECAALSAKICSHEATWSWRLTAPLRGKGLGKKFDPVVTTIRAAAKPFVACGEYWRRFIKYYKAHGAAQTRKRIVRQLSIEARSNGPLSNFFPADSCWHKIAFDKRSLKVSIIVPNYNHAEYLEERLNSIYSQTYTNYEVILLDDCSTDASRDILLRYQKMFPEKTRIIFNDVNSGRPFWQWLKGIEAAKGDLIWIAESDDYCDADFLEKLLPSFEDEAVLLAYCSTDFMQEGEKIWDLSAYLASFPLNFAQSFMMTAHDFVRQVMFCKNPIANGSSALFRKPVSLPEELKHTIASLKLCGDWLFYLYMIKGGVVSFVHDTKDYYRIHPQSTSLRVQKTRGYFEEQYRILSHITENYGIERAHIDQKYADISQEYASLRSSGNQKELDAIFDREALYRRIETRKPNIGMCCFAFTVGGGEFVPIHLANALRRLGYAVTFLDFDFVERNPLVRAILSPDIPVVHAPHARNFNVLMEQLGFDVLHSHHGSVDNVVSSFKRGQRYQHLVTFHGFYEAIADDDHACKVLRKLQQNDAHFVYIADKNLPLARQAGIDVDSLEKVPNGMPSMPVGTISRESLGLSDDDFVLCLVSRALPTKGWEEAAAIVDMVNERSSRPVHLLLIGDGEMYDKLKTCASQYVHCLGSRFTPQEYYALSDMGFFPSRYPGESFPLVNVECLLTGTPVIASDIGEIASQLTTESGGVAGALFQLEAGEIPIAKVADIVLSFINDKQLLEKAKENAKELSTKFDIIPVAQLYARIYSSLTHTPTT